MDQKDSQEQRKYPEGFKPGAARPTYGQYKNRNPEARTMESFLFTPGEDGTEQYWKASEPLARNPDMQVAANYNLQGSTPIPALRPNLNRYDKIEPLTDDKQRETLLKSHGDAEHRQQTEARRTKLCNLQTREMDKALKSNNLQLVEGKHKQWEAYCPVDQFTAQMADLQRRQAEKDKKETKVTQ
jgi:hypothetical protein